MDKPLVVYYSKTGTTDKLVYTIQPKLDAEYIRLEEEGKWFKKFIVNLSFQRENKKDLNVREFDPIILLTPVWHGKPTPAMNGFLDSVDLKGKRVVLGLVGAKEANPGALEKLRTKAILRGCSFIETVYLRGVFPGKNWRDMSEEAYTIEAEKLVGKVKGVLEFPK